MTTSRHDLTHGRQGGRIVDWVARAHPIELGARRLLDLDGFGRPVVTVTAHLSGDRLLVELDSGNTLIVRPHHLQEPAP